MSFPRNGESIGPRPNADVFPRAHRVVVVHPRPNVSRPSMNVRTTPYCEQLPDVPDAVHAGRIRIETPAASEAQEAEPS